MFSSKWMELFQTPKQICKAWTGTFSKTHHLLEWMDIYLIYFLIIFSRHHWTFFCEFSIIFLNFQHSFFMQDIFLLQHILITNPWRSILQQIFAKGQADFLNFTNIYNFFFDQPKLIPKFGPRPNLSQPVLRLTLNHAITQLRLNRFQWNLKLKLPTRKETIQNTIKDTSPSQECHNHHQLQPKIYICHRSLIGFLMPSNSSDFNQILNIAPSGHVETIKNVI